MKAKYDLIGQCQKCGGNLTSDHRCPGHHPEIESLKALDIPYNLRGNKDEAILDAMREIEYLREQVAHEERRAKAAEFAGIEAMKRGDEWKHRTKCLHDILDREGLLQAHAESADWFKEEK